MCLVPWKIHRRFPRGNWNSISAKNSICRARINGGSFYHRWWHNSKWRDLYQQSVFLRARAKLCKHFVLMIKKERLRVFGGNVCNSQSCDVERIFIIRTKATRLLCQSLQWHYRRLVVTKRVQGHLSLRTPSRRQRNVNLLRWNDVPRNVANI